MGQNDAGLLRRGTAHVPNRSRRFCCAPVDAGSSEAGGEGGEGGEEGLDAETALELVNLGVVVSPVTRETAGSLYHQELARQVGVHWVGWVHGGL